VLASEHADRPFLPSEPREAARRVLEVAGSLGLSVHVARGGLDVGGAELDHLWAVVDDRVVDVSLPLGARPFRQVLRAYVAGDLSASRLVAAAADWTLEWRVIGEVPPGCRYRGAPVLAHRRAPVAG
jgi:hypothetical protein